MLFRSVDGPQSIQSASVSSFTTTAQRTVMDHARELGLVGSLSQLRSLPATGGGQRVHVQQTIAGVPVMGGEAVVDLTAAGQPRAIVSEFLPDAPPSSLTPSLNAADAFAAYVRSSKRGATGATQRAVTSALSIYDPQIFGAPGIPGSTLVWKLTVRDSRNLSSTRTVLVDAVRGSIVLDIPNDEQLANITVCDNQSVPNDAYTIGCGQLSHQGVTLAPVRTVSNPGPIGNAEVDTAYDNTASTLDFYSAYLGRDSIDGHGKPITEIVNWCASDTSNPPCPYPNAYWDGEKMMFGTGFAAADDVVGHEISHGMTQNTADLFYYYQSGAINESLSDIFGEFIDQTDGHDVVGDSTSNLWQLGEDLTWVDSGTTFTGPLRNMADPTNPGSGVERQPDSTISPLFGNHNPWDKDANGYSIFDNGDVHLNSGVGNKFAFLLTDATSSNPLGPGVGIGKAAPIIFGAEQLLTSGADYRSLAAALRLSCAALVGKTTAHGDVVTTSDCQRVDAAIKAVKMDATPLGARAAATICPVGRKVKVLWHDDMERPTSGRWLKSTVGGYSTPALWYYGSQPISYYGGMWIGRYSTSGVNELWGDDPDPGDYYTTSNGVMHYIFGATKKFADHREAMSINILIPRGVPSFIRFNHSFGFDSFQTSTSVLHADGGLVEYSIDSGKTWLDARSLMAGAGNNGYNGTIDYWVNGKKSSTNPLVSAKHPARAAFVGQSRGYESSRIVLTSLAGKKVRIRFRITADQTGGEFGWAIDDVSFYSCVAP